MKRLALLGVILVLAGGLLTATLPAPAPVFAEQPTPEAPKRLTSLKVNYTQHEWWLVRWKNNEITCRFLVEHEGLPIADEIRVWCGNTLYNEWLATPPCTLTSPEQTAQTCKGLYLFEFSSYPASKDVEVELPLPSAWVSITGCTPQPPGNRCDSLPNLLLTGEEPLPNEMIISIQGQINGEPFVCHGEACAIPLQPTGQGGINIEFWADSSYGDASKKYSALVRVIPQGDFMSPDGASSDAPLFYVDVLSTQWRGGAQASCLDVWQSFPPVGGPAPWLTTPDDPQALYSAVSLYYLAGMLIANGEVDASECRDGGLQTPLTASECGVRAAYEQVLAWQNQFDEEILQVALDSGVPAQLLKNIFSRESQFWPGIYRNYKEAGLGQLTEMGADAVLLWNPSFFDAFCPLVLHQSRCNLGFGNIKEEERVMLRGALVGKVNAACDECPAGIDLSQAHFSIQVFAEGMIGNCEQVGRIFSNLTGRAAGASASYEDLWRFTLVNYNAGSGCLSNAMRQLIALGQPLTWDNLAPKLEPACQGAIKYVNDISEKLSGARPTPTSWVYPGQPPPLATVVTLPPGVTPVRQATLQPGVTPQPGDSGYPAPQPTLPEDYPYPVNATPTLYNPYP
ncbi:MAG: hypothetical protein ROW48_06650 [Bellilinea sp.]|jgi:hypothetical protein